MALPVGVTYVTNIKGDKGDPGDAGRTGTLAFATAESVDAGSPADVTMIGPEENRGAHFKIPRGLPGVNAIENDAAVAEYVDAVDSETHAALRRSFAGLDDLPVGVKSPRARALLDTIVGFGKPDGGLLIGQQIGREADAASSYTQHIVGLETQTGSKPAILGVDLGARADLAELPSTLAMTLAKAREFAALGGIITASWHTANPWTWTGPQVGGGDQPGSSKDRLPPATDLEKIFTPGDPVHDLFMQHMEFVVDEFLAPLHQDGTPVLWRPFHECTGTWFWWGAFNDGTPVPVSFYSRLWGLMYRYMVHDRGLDNLVWIYNAASSTHQRPTHFYWGIEQYADVVSWDLYSDSGLWPQIEDLRSTGKPIALAEWGPGTVNGTYEVSRIIGDIERLYPDIAWVTAWWDVTPAQKFSWSSNLGTQVLTTSPQPRMLASITGVGPTLTRTEPDAVNSVLYCAGISLSSGLSNANFKWCQVLQRTTGFSYRGLVDGTSEITHARSASRLLPARVRELKPRAVVYAGTWPSAENAISIGEFQAHIRNIAAVCRREGAQLVIPLLPPRNSGMAALVRAYNSWLMWVASQIGITVCDMTDIEQGGVLHPDYTTVANRFHGLLASRVSGVLARDPLYRHESSISLLPDGTFGNPGSWSYTAPAGWSVAAADDDSGMLPGGQWLEVTVPTTGARQLYLTQNLNESRVAAGDQLVLSGMVQVLDPAGEWLPAVTEQAPSGSAVMHINGGSTLTGSTSGMVGNRVGDSWVYGPTWQPATADSSGNHRVALGVTAPSGWGGKVRFGVIAVLNRTALGW